MLVDAIVDSHVMVPAMLLTDVQRFVMNAALVATRRLPSALDLVVIPDMLLAVVHRFVMKVAMVATRRLPGVLVPVTILALHVMITAAVTPMRPHGRACNTAGKPSPC